MTPIEKAEKIIEEYAGQTFYDFKAEEWLKDRIAAEIRAVYEECAGIAERNDKCTCRNSVNSAWEIRSRREAK